MEPAIELAPHAGDNGLAEMLSQLLRQNLDERSEKRSTFMRMLGRVAIVVEDLNTAVTLDFQRGRLVIHHGIVGIPDVTVRADYESVMTMSLVELEPRLGLPDFRGEKMREVAQRTRDKKIQVFGALANVPLLLRLTKVMSVAQ